MNDPMQFDKIWIEIEPVEDRSEASQKIAQARCNKANIAVKLLGITMLFTVNPDYFNPDWQNKGHWADQPYHITEGRSGQFMVLKNNGHWFDLDYISKTGFWEQKKAG